jgi:Protein of unknown function (DUF2865)
VSRIARLYFALVLAASAAIVVPATAQAEGLFGAILNLFGGGRPAPQEPAPPPPQPGPSAANPLDHFGLNNQPLPPSHGGPQVAYCVRTCDGRYFPLFRNAGGPNATAKICSALCPTAETKIFSGSNIETAVAPDGSRYANLKNAFVYRERLVDGCSCNGGNGAGNSAIDVKSDPTLRPGDIVVTGQGPMMFKGGKGETHARSDFAPVADNTRMSAQLRDKVNAIKVAKPGNVPVASPQNVAPAASPAATPVIPAETVARIFDFKDFDNAELRGSTAMGYSGQQ